MKMRKIEPKEQGTVTLDELKPGDLFEGAHQSIYMRTEKHIPDGLHSCNVSLGGFWQSDHMFRDMPLHRARIVSVDSNGTLVWERVTG